MVNVAGTGQSSDDDPHGTPPARQSDAGQGVDDDWLQCGGGVDIFIFTEVKKTANQEGPYFQSRRRPRKTMVSNPDCINKGDDTRDAP